MAKATKTVSKPHRTQQERRDATSNAVLQSAIKLFGERGYQNTSLEDVAKDSGNTIRPIYHYFKNKKNLFKAVAESREQYLFEVLEGLEEGRDDTLSVAEYWRAFADVCKEPGFRQIVLIDAPNILGRERWMDSPIVKKAIDYFYGLYPNLSEQSRMLVSRVFVAALTEAAMVMSETEEADHPSFEDLFSLFENFR